jgi:hypothetical protein
LFAGSCGQNSRFYFLPYLRTRFVGCTQLP